MSWPVAGNQCVSCNNLQAAVTAGVFTAKTTIPATNKEITKTEADTYVYIDTTYPSYAAKASNQLVVSNDLVSSTTSSQKMIYSTQFGGTNTGLIRFSANGGTSFSTIKTTANISSARMSPSGNHMIATTDQSSNNIIFSTDGGSTWSTNNATAGGTSIIAGRNYADISYSGQYMFVYTNSTFYRSTSYGATFASTTSISGGTFTAMKCSGSGQYVFLSTSGGTLFRSNDYGATFSYSMTSPISSVFSIAVSYLGQYVSLTSTSSLNVYVSSNGNTSSVTFTAKNVLSGVTGSVIVMSQNGQYLIALNTSYTSFAYSTDYGVNWSTSTVGSGITYTGYIDINSSGNYMAMQAYTNIAPSDCYTYTSTNFTTWVKRELTPSTVLITQLSMQ